MVLQRLEVRRLVDVLKDLGDNTRVARRVEIDLLVVGNLSDLAGTCVLEVGRCGGGVGACVPNVGVLGGKVHGDGAAVEGSGFEGHI